MTPPPPAFRDWSQGDATLDVRALPFIDRNDDAVDVAVEGVVVLTQTCDILNAANEVDVPALIQVAALIRVDERFVEETKRFWKPRYMHVPAVADRQLVADLNVCATFDRAVLGDWTRIAAPDDAEARKATEFALGRHRNRHAFPDRWSPAFGRVRDWIRSKGGKDSDEGRFVDAIQEMRVVAEESATPAKAVVVVIIPRTIHQNTRLKWHAELLPKLKDRVDKTWNCEVDFILQTLSEMTAEDYVSSSLMDFDALTRAANDDRVQVASATASIAKGKPGA